MIRAPRAGRLAQTKIYLGKCMRTFINEKSWSLLISTLIISIILAWIVGDNTFEVNESTINGIFAMICGCIWTGLFNSIQSVCRERDVIKREHRTGLHISSYLAAHIIFDFFLCTAEGIILTTVFDVFRDFPSDGVIFSWIDFEFFISFTLVIFASDVLGLMVSCIVKTEKAAMTVMPFVLIIQLVLSGVMFELPEDSEFLKNFTVSSWGVSAIGSSSDVNELPTKDTLMKFEEAAMSDSSIHSWKDLGLTQEYLMEYDASSKHVCKNWLVLLLYSSICATAGTLCLKLVDRDKR